MAWHRTWWAGWALRLAGAALIGGAVLAGRRLDGAADLSPVFAPGGLDVLLALLAFGCATGGAAALVLGGHLFDRVTVSSPWLHTAPRRRPRRG